VGLVKTHQKPTVKPTPTRSPPEKPNPAWCGFSNRKPTPTHTIPTSNEKSIVIEIKKRMKTKQKVNVK
jgi:hypothetical protein